MANIQPLKITEADQQIAKTLNHVKSKLGMIPNLISTFAHSKPVLESYLQFSDNLSRGLLTAKQREMISLAVSQANLCQYCLSAHTLLGKAAGLTNEDIKQARVGEAKEHVDYLIVSFAREIAVQRGLLATNAVDNLRKHGFHDELIIEIIANVVINIMTNYTNNIAHTDIDFPLASLS